MGDCSSRDGGDREPGMATAKINLLDDPPDFSIVLGGPLFQLLRRAHLEGNHLELLYRRLIFFLIFLVTA